MATEKKHFTSVNEICDSEEFLTLRESLDVLAEKNIDRNDSALDFFLMDCELEVTEFEFRCKHLEGIKALSSLASLRGKCGAVASYLRNGNGKKSPAYSWANSLRDSYKFIDGAIADVLATY